MALSDALTGVRRSRTYPSLLLWCVAFGVDIFDGSLFRNATWLLLHVRSSFHSRCRAYDTVSGSHEVLHRNMRLQCDI